MSCRADVRKSILEAIITDIADGRHTYSPTEDNTKIKINSVRDNPKTRVKSKTNAYEQARAIADERIKFINTSSKYNGHILAYMSNVSPYDPVYIGILINPAYVEEEYRKLPIWQQTDPADNLSQEELEEREEMERSVRRQPREFEQRQKEGFYREVDGEIVPYFDDFFQTIYRDSTIPPDIEFKSSRQLKDLLLEKGILTTQGKKTIVTSRNFDRNFDFLIQLQQSAQSKYNETPFTITEVKNKFDVVTHVVTFNPPFFDLSPNFSIDFNLTGQRSATAETVRKVTTLAKSLGITIESVPDLLEKHGVTGIAKLSKMLIEVQEGKAPEALTEEFMHFVTFMLPKNELDTLFKEITEYNIYKRVYESYKDLPEYQKDGQPDITKIKLEAIGKLLAEFYIYKNEHLSKEEVAIGKTLWGRIKDIIRALLNKKNDILRLIDEIENNPSFLQALDTEYDNFLQSLPTLTPREKVEIEDKIRLYRKEAFEKGFTQFRADFKNLFTVAKNLGINEQMLFQLSKLMTDTEEGTKIFSSVEGYFEYLQGVAKMLENTKVFAKDLNNPNSPFYSNRVTLTYWTITFSDIYRNQIDFLEQALNMSGVPDDNAFKEVVREIKNSLGALEEIRNGVLEEGISEKIVEELAHVNDLINKEFDEKIAAVRNVKNKQKLGNQAKYQKLIDELERKRQNSLITKENIIQELNSPISKWKKVNGKLQEMPERRMGLITSMFLALHMNPNMLVQSVDQVIKRALNEEFPEVQTFTVKLTNLAKKAKAIGKDFTFVDKAWSFAQSQRTKVSYVNGERREDEVLVLRDKVDHLAFHNDFEELNETRRKLYKRKVELLNDISGIDNTDPDASIIEEELNKLLEANSIELENQDKQIKQFIEDYAEQKYTDEYLALNNDLPQIAKDARQDVLDEINRVSYMVDLNDVDESTLELLDSLWLKFNRLESLYNEDGSLKVGDDKVIAEAIRDWKAKRHDHELMLFKLKPRSEKLWQAQKMRMDTMLSTAKRNFTNGVISQAELEVTEKQVSEWYKRNVKWTPTEEFYEERQRISEAIDAISLRWNYTNPNLDSVSELWEEIFNIIKGYRNTQGYINAREIGVNLQRLVAQKEKQIEDLKDTLSQHLKDLGKVDPQAKADRMVLISLFEELKQLQEKILTPSEEDPNLSLYHAEVAAQITMQEHIYRANNPVDYLNLSPAEQQAYNNKVKQHALIAYQTSEWYLANHVEKKGYEDGQEIVESVPSYIWWIVKPKQPQHIIDEHPTQRWYTPSLNPKYLRLDANGKPLWLGPDGKMKPREGTNKYQDSSYNNLTTEEKDLLDEIKALYFNVQARLPKYARLGYVVPHVRKEGWDSTADLLRGKNVNVKDAGISNLLKRIGGFFNNTWSRIIGRDESDEDYLMPDEDGSYEKIKTYDRSKMVNIKHLRPVGITRQSFDLIESIARYGVEAHRYSSLHRIVPFVFGVKEYFNTHPVNEQERGWLATQNQKNQRKLITEKINRIILRDTANSRTASGVAKTLNSITSAKALTARLDNDFKNLFAALVQQLGMSGVVQISTTDLLVAYKNVLRKTVLFSSVLADTFRTGKPSKYTRLLNYYDVVQGNVWDKLPSKMTVTAGRVITNLEGWLGKVKEVSEPVLQAALFEAVARKHYVTLNGNKYKVVDLYSWNDATEQMELTIDLDTLLASTTPEDRALERKKLEKQIKDAQEILRNDVRLANQLLLGQYSSFDQPYVKRFFFGRMFMNMKGFLPTMFIAAYGKERIHYGSGRTVHGLYNWFITSFIRDLFVLRANTFSQMTSREQALLRAFVRHQMVVASSVAGYYLMTMAFAGDGDDDKEDDATQAYGLLVSKKTLEEIRYFHPYLKADDWYYRYFVTKAGGKNVATEFFNWAGIQSFDVINAFDTRNFSFRYTLEDFSFAPYKETNKGEYLHDKGFEFYDNMPAIAATFARLTPFDNAIKFWTAPEYMLQSSRDFDPTHYDFVSQKEEEIRRIRSEHKEKLKDIKKAFMEEHFGVSRFKELTKPQQSHMKKYSRMLNKKYKIEDVDEMRKAIYTQNEEGFKR